MSFLENFNSKKFMFSIVVILLNFGLVCAKVIDGSTYSTVILATVGAYLTSNVAALHLNGTNTGSEK
jgi:hypothetical protein